MSSRRLVVLPALAAALFAASGAFAVPTITPETLQCDGTYAPSGTTANPNPSIQAIVQDPTGLRIGQARMGNTSTPLAIRALWRFDVAADVALTCLGGNTNDYVYSYSDPNNSDTMFVGECQYSAPGCGASGALTAAVQVPLGQTICPAVAPSVGAGAAAIFPAGQFGDEATFNGVQFGSVTYNRTGLGDRDNTYTLSAWIKTSAGGLQRIISEQGPNGFWGFGLNGGSLRLFDSRNVDGVIGNQTDVAKAASVNDGAWHKVDVVRIDGTSSLQNHGQERFYVDGSFIGFVAASSTDSFVNHPISHPVMIGMYEGISEFFNGQIDELRVLDAALSDEELRLEYKGSNFHKYAASPAAAYGIVSGGLAAANGDTGADLYTISDGAITTASAPNQRWMFEAQSDGTISTISSTFTVTIDQRAPTVPQAFSGAPTGTNFITWSWTASARFCPPPGSASVFYSLFDATNGGAALNPPGNIAYTSLSVSENIPGTPNQIRSRRLSLTDVWGASPLTPPASAYTMAAVPAGLTAVSVSTGGFVATWNAAGNPGYTRYELTYTSDPSFAVGVATRVGINDNFTGTSIGITGLPSGTTYYVRVYAFNGQNADAFGGLRSAGFGALSVVTEPGAPTLTGAPLSATAVQWTWTRASGASGYTLYDSPTQAVLFNGAALAFTSSTLSVNTRYDAEVEADQPAPTPPSGRGHAFTYTKANPPLAPAVAAVYATSATFTWNPNGNPANTFYQVIVTTDATFGVVTATLTVSAPTATATGLLPGVIYYSQVEAINGGQIETGYVPIPQTVTAADPVITVSSSPPSPYVAPVGLVGAWQFDEDTGTVTADGSGGGNTANFGCAVIAPALTCVSTPTFAAGPPGLGSAASFTGQSGGVVLTNSGAPFGFLGSVTVEAWVNPATAAQTPGAGIVSVGPQNAEDFALDVSPTGSFRFLTAHGGAEFPVTVATATIAAGLWTHVVGVYDLAHATSTLYLNGRPAAVAAAPARVNSGAVLAVGNRLTAGGKYALPFAGRVDSVRVIASALTAPQVLADYLGGFVSSVTPPSPNNGIVVALPPNAFGAPAQIFISADPVNHPIRITPAALNAGLTVTPSGLTLVPHSLVEVVPVVGGLPFTAPLGSSATLTIPYNDPGNTGLISGTNPPLAVGGLQMYTLNTAVNSWTLLPTTVDKSKRAVSGVTPHFSVFALFAPATVGTNLSGVKAFPVPWKPGSGGRFDGPGVTFANLPAAGTIRILTLAGRRVRDFTFNGVSAGSAVWDGLNDDGRRTASGVYFARITSSADNSNILVKFAIER